MHRRSILKTAATALGILLRPAGPFAAEATGQSEDKAEFYLPPEPDYTIVDSIRDSVRFATQRTLSPYRGNLRCTSSFVDPTGKAMKWHDFGTLEGPGWAANAAGGAYELYLFGRQTGDHALQRKGLHVLDHVLEDGFIDYETGFITGYRDTADEELYLNFKHDNTWLCPGSMAKIAFQLLTFSDLLAGDRRKRARTAAAKNAAWIARNVKDAPNGWYPRRVTPDGTPYRKSALGGGDPIFQKSGDGLFIVQLMTALTRRGMADYRATVRQKVDVFMEHDGLFGSINHDTYDEHECVAYAVAFRTLTAAAELLDDPDIRTFAYETCLAGMDRFKMKENRNGVQTKGLLYMEESWDTAYLWENAEAALAYLEAYLDTGREEYRRWGLTILRACANHHHGPHGFLTEGVDWNNHVGSQHHFDGAEYGDIKYTEPLLNNLHIVEPTVLAMREGLLERGT